MFENLTGLFFEMHQYPHKSKIGLLVYWCRSLLGLSDPTFYVHL